MKAPRLIFFFAVIFAVVANAQQPASFYVATNGNDAFPGTIKKPFATPERARLAVRKMLRGKPQQAVSVFFRKGVYSFKQSFRLDSLDSGNEKAPVTYCAYPGEEVKFSGGISVPVSKAVPITDKKIVDQVVAGARKNILQVNLKALGLNDFGSLKPKGFGRPSSAAPMELFL